MTKDYSKGYVYRLACNKTGKQYIGSSINTPHQRLGGHVGDYKQWLIGKQHYKSSYEIIKEGDYEIILIEKYPCSSKFELEYRERYWIETLECVNIQIPRRTEEEKKEYRQNYKETNSEYIKQQNKVWYENNKETISEKAKEYYLANKEIIDEKHKEYKAQFDKEVINEKARNRYHEVKEKKVCECGKPYITKNYKRHCKTQKHIDYINKYAK